MAYISAHVNGQIEVPADGQVQSINWLIGMDDEQLRSTEWTAVGFSGSGVATVVRELSELLLSDDDWPEVIREYAERRRRYFAVLSLNPPRK